MKLLFVPMMIGVLAIAGMSPAAAQSKSDQGTSVGVATTHDSTTERNSYRQKAQEEMQIWQKRLHDFDAKMQGQATEAQASASKDLDDAWTETKSASSQLEIAADADWDAAKASFKKASDRLTVAWHRVNPTDK